MKKMEGSVLAKRFPCLVSRLEGVKAAEHETLWSSGVGDASAVLDRWLESLDIDPYSALALSGIGDGRHLERLLDSLPKGCAIFCAEEKLSVFRAFAESDLGKRLLEDCRLFVGAGELNELFFESMSAFPVLEAGDASPVIFAPIFNQSEKYYSEFFLEFVRRFDYWRKLFGTNALFSGDWQENTFANLPQLIGAPDIGEFRGAFVGKEMLVASAGPSLDESLEYLKSVQDRAVLVAVNSSFQALRNAGIDPHFVLAADPYETTDKGFEGVDLGASILVCPFIVYPRVAERFSDQAATWSRDNLLASYLRLKLGLGQGSGLLELGTVSICAFDLAEILACSSITFFGQDLAVRDDGRSHASDSFYSDMKMNRVALERCRWVPGNTLDKVPVEEKLFVYLRAFEQLARERSQSMKLRNASRLGARIEGMPYVSIESLESKTGGASDDSIAKTWAEIQECCRLRKDFSSELSSELERVRSFANELASRALQGAILLESLDFQNLEANESEALPEALKLRDGIVALTESEPDYFKILQDGQLKFEMLQFRREAREFESVCEDESRRSVLELKSYFWALAEGSFRFASSMRR